MTTTAWADISGSPLVNYGNLDQCSGCVFPIVQFGAQNAGQTVLSFSLYDGNAASNGNILTPLLFEESIPGTFTVIGVGDAETGFTPALNLNIPFVLAAGTAVVQDANTFFGYVDGSADGSAPNAGTVSMNYPVGVGPVEYYSSSYSVVVGVPVAFTSLSSIPQGPRTYALDVTTTPEPGFYGLLAVGLGGLALAIRRRSV